jgi:hypothetical protein
MPDHLLIEKYVLLEGATIGNLRVSVNRVRGRKWSLFASPIDLVFMLIFMLRQDQEKKAI